MALVVHGQMGDLELKSSVAGRAVMKSSAAGKAVITSSGAGKSVSRLRPARRWWKRPLATLLLALLLGQRIVKALNATISLADKTPAIERRQESSVWLCGCTRVGRWCHRRRHRRCPCPGLASAATHLAAVGLGRLVLPVTRGGDSGGVELGVLALADCLPRSLSRSMIISVSTYWL